MEELTWMLRHAARLLPPERRPWAEALQAEAGQVPVGWPRLRWLAGGLWLVIREAHVARKIVYWLGLGAVAAAAVWAVMLSWQTAQTDVESATDRARILAGAVALLLLPWAAGGAACSARSVTASPRGWCGWPAAWACAAWAWCSCG